MADSDNQSQVTRGQALSGVRRVVVKVGSGVIAGQGRLHPDIIAALAADVHGLRKGGLEIVMVVSGAVAAGYRLLGLERPPVEVVERQAAAAVGQYRLMTLLAEAFGAHGVAVAQMLLMQDDIENRVRFLSARHTLQLLLRRGVLPVINENDPLATDEAKIGDNDHLAALVTSLASAQLLVILSTVPGVRRTASDNTIISEVLVGSSIDEHISCTVSESGVGGMIAKVSAARLASEWGVPTIIAGGPPAGLLPRIMGGEPLGTLFRPRTSTLSARKRWIAVRTKSRGIVQVDEGACAAILQRGASLLPSGVVGVEGKFSMGARVDIHSPAGSHIAFGLVSYSSDEIRLMRGKRRADFQQVLGYEYVPEIIHRDDMVLLAGTKEAMT